MKEKKYTKQKLYRPTTNLDSYFAVTWLPWLPDNYLDHMSQSVEKKKLQIKKRKKKIPRKKRRLVRPIAQQHNIWRVVFLPKNTNFPYSETVGVLADPSLGH